MIRYRFLRQSFLVSLLIAVAIPFYTVFFLLPSLTAQLVNTFEENAISVAHHLSAMLREHHLLQDGQIAIAPSTLASSRPLNGSESALRK